MQKKDLRKEFLNKRMHLSRQEIDFLSGKILDLFNEKFNLKNERICTFLPIESKNEINTFKLFDLNKKKDFTLFTTKWNTKTNELSIHKLKSKDELVLNTYQIPEPKHQIEIQSPVKISIVLIPLLCFDKDGNRIGYGKGVYDQFLIKFNQEETLFIGLSFFDPIDKISDVNEFDVKLHYCITPNTIYKFEK